MQYESKIANAVTRLGLAPHVRVVGHLPMEALPDYYQASDLVVSVASSEGFPNTVLEVMACGVPVLAGDLPQIRELLTDGVNARLCPISVAGIEVAMTGLLADSAAASRLAATGRLTATEFGDIARNGQRRAAELRALAASGKRQGLPSSLLYRLVLRIYQVTRFLGFNRAKASRGND